MTASRSGMKRRPPLLLRYASLWDAWKAISRLGLNFKSKPQLFVAYGAALLVAFVAEGRHAPGPHI